MPLKLTCPQCRSAIPLTEPLPLPGDELQCAQCAGTLAVNYPAGVVEQLRSKGKKFARSERPQVANPGPRTVGSFIATEVDGGPRTQSAADGLGIDRTVPGSRSPYGQLAGGVAEADGALASGRDLDPTQAYTDANGEPDSLSDPTGKRKRAQPARPARPVAEPKRREGKPRSKVVRRAGLAGCLGTTAMGLLGTALAGAVLGCAAMGFGYWHYSQDLPTVEVLRAYEPPTVTVVTDANGATLGEIFDQRRYVVPIEGIPQHVQNAFIAAEDANFFNHGGIDYMGIVRAMGRNAAQGRMAQGASTITQQVARNFLLTRDKKLERKVKEVILSWRIEDAYTKEHILYLYLNEIFLGAQSYGVEAASRSYFNKSVKEVTLAEAAILAGLPQRPSDYAPNKHWKNAKERQKYVLGQMLDKGLIQKSEHDAALAEEVKIAPANNAFRQQAPWFTEHVRRYLVDKYGEEAVLRQGLQVKTTCDLTLQQVAQKGVTAGVDDADQRMGFRRAGLEHLPSKDAVASRREAQETALREAESLAADPAGRLPLPDRSTLTVGSRYPAVVLEVAKGWARVGIGAHEGVIPIAWSDWVYDPDPMQSWRSRIASDFTEPVDVDLDRKPDGALLQAGDVVEVLVAGLDTRDPAVAKAFEGTPGASARHLALKLYQNAEAEGALFSMELASGAVRAMVGGSDFDEGQFNRAVQSRRQVGSTFKPIVYAAAIASKQITAATIMPDAPIAFATEEDVVWKPSNYSNDYLGNITIRRALALSRNTVTVRVLESIDPGMNHDLVYRFARSLGIGGPPTYALPADWVPSPENDVLCPWTREKPDSTICMDHFPPRTDPTKTNTAHRAGLVAADNHSCRACDYSMALGSASLTMEELVRAYSAFPSGGKLIEPYYVEEVRDRHGALLEQHAPTEFAQVMEPGVASITTWLLEGVVSEGTGNLAKRELGLAALGGKTGTTNEEKDAWFVGFTNDTITSVWVGFDQPKSLGISSTGGRTALPIWIDYMRVAAPKSKDRPFTVRGPLDTANIDEETGRRVSEGGRTYPFLPGTAPESTGIGAGQVSLEDLATDL